MGVPSIAVIMSYVMKKIKIKSKRKWMQLEANFTLIFVKLALKGRHIK